MPDPGHGAESSPPSCPHCNSPLRLGGKIVEERGIKKWIDEWECPDHGAIGATPSDEGVGEA